MSKIINLSKFINNHINTYIDNIPTIKREKKTNIIDGFIFGLLYTQKEITKDFITAKYNNLTKNNACRKSYTMRCNQISLEYLETLYSDLSTYINNNIYKNNNNKQIQLYGVDGCKINTNIKLSNHGYIPNNSNTSCCILTMGVYSSGPLGPERIRSEGTIILLIIIY